MNDPRPTSSPARRRTGGGFTLFELVIVMVVVATLVAISMPSLRGFWSGSRSRDAATEFLAVTQWARAKSAAEARIYRLSLDATNGDYQLTVQEGVEFVETGDEFGQIHSLPEGMRMEVVRLGLTPDAVGQIDFHPDGRCDVAAIRLTEPDGTVTTIASLSPAEPFRILTAAETQQLIR
jgi:prepilin-type N-terminal cleavage/methylation domain-containing protein